MASASLETAGGPSCGALLLDALAEQGSGAHPWCSGAASAQAGTASRDFADLVHHLCVLHGRYPGLVDHAAGRVTDPAARTWLTNASYAFAGERAFLARLAVAAGPVPSTPGSAGSDAALLGQRQAMETLARSEREGCALGAAIALVLDWAAIRRALDAAASRFGVEAPEFTAGESGRLIALVDGSARSAPMQRALLFGASQVFHQHYGLWDLLDARRQARAEG
jgi:hypothetical protein